MARLTTEIALAVAMIVFGLEAVHYRNAVLAANIDLKRAWTTVVDLREKCEQSEAPSHAPLRRAAGSASGSRSVNVAP